MTARRPYPAYKDSGIAWLGEIPAHWDVQRLKFVAELIMGQSPKSETYNDRGDGYPFLQGNAEFGLYHPHPSVYCDVAKKHALPGDYLLSVRAPVGAINVADQRYGIGRGLCCIRPGFILGHDFTWYLLEVIRNQLEMVSTGSTYEAVSIDQVADLICVLPPLSEQRAIAAFFDRETARIDALIAKKQRLIELLQEKRTALISHAVTKGLDPDAPMKDSGVEWIGEIPAGWKVMQLRYLLRSIETGWTPKSEQRLAGMDEWGVLKVGCVRDGRFIEMEHKALSPEVSPAPWLEVQNGDLLMSRANTTELVGSVGVVRNPRPHLTLSDKTFRLVPNHRLSSEYANYLLQSKIARHQIEVASTGASPSMKNIAQDSVASLKLPVSCFTEQLTIAAFLDRETARIDALITKIETAIAKLQEYRTALISAAVTGKIDVRGVGATHSPQPTSITAGIPSDAPSRSGQVVAGNASTQPGHTFPK